MNILLTGGAGYIGTHAAVALIEAGHRVVLYDNLCNSQPNVIQQLEKITRQPIILVQGDVRDTSLLMHTLNEHAIEAVIHLAGLKAVNDSVAKPIEYYSNNIQGSICLLLAMQESGVKALVFSSSATVYGIPQYLPLDEDHPRYPTNPYGRSKLYVEEMLADVAMSDASWRIACLRYFNPVGAHESGLIGEAPKGTPNNLMPYVAQVAVGKRPHLDVFGNDYPTSDGTGIRDYIHVLDLADGHLAALNFLNHSAGWHTFNLGTGHGRSVLEMVHAFEDANKIVIPYQIKPRRMGDIAACFTSSEKAEKWLGWSATRTIEQMCTSSWLYQKNCG